MRHQSTLLLLLVCAVAMPRAARSQVTAPPDQPAPKTELAPDIPRSWRFVTGVASAFDSNVDRDPAAVVTYGGVLSAGFRYRSSPEDPALEIDYDVGVHRYASTARWDRVSQAAAIRYELELGDRWELETVGEASLKGSTEDRELADVYSIQPRLEFKIDHAFSISLLPTLRFKRYPDQPGRNAVNPYMALELERKSGDGSKLEIASRYERKQTRVERGRYLRWVHEVEFSWPVGERNEFELELEYRSKRYLHRLVEVEIDDDELDVPRRDQKWRPSVAWVRRLSRGIDVSLEYEYETRVSNDPEKWYDAHLLFVQAMVTW